MIVNHHSQRPFLAGVIAEAKFYLGRESNEKEPSMYFDAPHLSQLRVSWVDPTLVAEQWTVDLNVAGIGPIGPIDLPFTFNVEGNVEIAVRPLAAPANANDVLAVLCDLPNCSHLYHATHLPKLVQGVVAIPNWVVAVTVFGDPLTMSGQFQDIGNNVIANFPAGPSPVARPRTAAFIQVTGETTCLFHY